MATESQESSNRLVDVIHCLTARQEHFLVASVKAAYREGCTTADLLAAIDIARYLRDVPSPLLRHAWQAVHDWAWIDARRRAAPGVPPSPASTELAGCVVDGGGTSLERPQVDAAGVS